MKAPKAIVLYGDGINCESETSFALTQAGFESVTVHTSEFLEKPDRLFQAQLLAIPGGFSFGDEIASGKVLAVKIRHTMMDLLHSYMETGGLVLGICNGFQVLVQLGLLPFSESGSPRLVSLVRNSGGRFINRWVELDAKGQERSPFFQGLKRIHLPIRHGEGRIAIAEASDAELLSRMKGQVALSYAEDINGSFEKIAGLTNTKGNVLGLMPHPEAFVRWSQHPAYPTWKRANGSPAGGISRHPRFPDGEPDGLVILRNARACLN